MRVALYEHDDAEQCWNEEGDDDAEDDAEPEQFVQCGGGERPEDGRREPGRVCFSDVVRSRPGRREFADECERDETRAGDSHALECAGRDEAPTALDEGERGVGQDGECETPEQDGSLVVAVARPRHRHDHHRLRRGESGDEQPDDDPRFRVEDVEIRRKEGR